MRLNRRNFLAILVFCFAPAISAMCDNISPYCENSSQWKRLIQAYYPETRFLWSEETPQFYMALAEINGDVYLALYSVKPVSGSEWSKLVGWDVLDQDGRTPPLEKYHEEKDGFFMEICVQKDSMAFTHRRYNFGRRIALPTNRKESVWIAMKAIGKEIKIDPSTLKVGEIKPYRETIIQ